jgi:hypothetical protein
VTPEEIEALQQRAAAAEAKVAELQPLATIGKQQLDLETTRVETAKAKLSKEHQALVDAQPSLEMKAQLVTALAWRSPSPNPGTGAPAPRPSQASFEEAWGTPKWAEVKASDPDGAAKWVRGKMGGPQGGITPLAHLPRGKSA